MVVDYAKFKSRLESELMFSLCSRLMDIDVRFPPERLEIKNWQHDQ
jgi:hypothetical protein